MKAKDRIFGLDLLRAYAILSVLIMHGSMWYDDTFLQGFPYFNMIDGVDIFFALSGYLIGKILLKEINKEQGFGIKELKQFWIRRWFRTLPNYYLILLLNYLVVKYQIIHEHISEFNWKFLFFLQNFNQSFQGFFWESWTLCVEEWFYIFSPILILLALKIFKPKKAFLISTLILILFPIIQRSMVYSPNCTEAFWGLELRREVIFRIDSIAFGLFGAWVFYYYPLFWHKIKWIAFSVALIINYILFNYHPGFGSIYVQILQLSLSPLEAMLFLPLAETIRYSFGFIGKIITHISKISYSMYLINLGLVAEVIQVNFPPNTPQQGLFTFFAFVAIVIVFSSLLYKFYEKPIMDLRDRKGISLVE